MAGSAAATVVAGWLAPLLIGVSVVLLARSFWVLYVQKRGSGAIKILTWLSACFVVCFWTWQLLLKK